MHMLWLTTQCANMWCNFFIAFITVAHFFDPVTNQWECEGKFSSFFRFFALLLIFSLECSCISCLKFLRLDFYFRQYLPQQQSLKSLPSTNPWALWCILCAKWFWAHQCFDSLCLDCFFVWKKILLPSL